MLDAYEPITIHQYRKQKKNTSYRIDEDALQVIMDRK